MGIILTSSIIARPTPTIIPTKHPTSPKFLSNSRNFPWISNPVRMKPWRYSWAKLKMVRTKPVVFAKIRVNGTCTWSSSPLQSCAMAIHDSLGHPVRRRALIPIFVMAESVQHLVPSLIAEEPDRWRQFEGKGNKKPQTWQGKIGGATAFTIIVFSSNVVNTISSRMQSG